MPVPLSPTPRRSSRLVQRYRSPTPAPVPTRKRPRDREVHDSPSTSPRALRAEKRRRLTPPSTPTRKRRSSTPPPAVSCKKKKENSTECLRKAKAKSPPPYALRLRGRQIPASPNDPSCSTLRKSTPASPPTRSSTVRPRSKAIPRPAEMDMVDLPNPIPSSRPSHPPLPALHIQIPERVHMSMPETTPHDLPAGGEQISKDEAVGQEPQYDHDHKHDLAAPLPIVNIQPLPPPAEPPSPPQTQQPITDQIPSSIPPPAPASASSEHGYYHYSPAPPSPHPQAHIPMWEEPLPPYDREWGLWKTACRVRVWEIQRRYSAPTIRSVVAQEANDFYVKHGIPRWWGGSGVWNNGQWLELKVGGARVHEDGDDAGGDGEVAVPASVVTNDGEEESTDGEDWSEYESELSDSDDALLHAPPGEDECDAEGEPDPEADPTYNAELSSPVYEPTAGGCNGQMSAFYVPPTPSPSSPVIDGEYSFPNAASSQEYHYQQQPPFSPPPDAHQHQTQYLPSPGYSYPRTPPPPPPVLPLPPPRLATIRVRALSALEIAVGSPVLGRGTPVDRGRAAAWAAACKARMQEQVGDTREGERGAVFEPDQEAWDAFLMSLERDSGENVTPATPARGMDVDLSAAEGGSSQFIPPSASPAAPSLVPQSLAPSFSEVGPPFSKLTTSSPSSSHPSIPSPTFPSPMLDDPDLLMNMNMFGMGFTAGVGVGVGMGMGMGMGIGVGMGVGASMLGVTTEMFGNSSLSGSSSSMPPSPTMMVDGFGNGELQRERDVVLGTSSSSSALSFALG